MSECEESPELGDQDGGNEKCETGAPVVGHAAPSSWFGLEGSKQTEASTRMMCEMPHSTAMSVGLAFPQVYTVAAACG